MEALAGLLTRERVLVELLVFKLVAMRQLLLAGETRFLPWAAEEVERATEAVRAAELERAVLVAEIGRVRGLAEPTLRELVADAPEPWEGLLTSELGQLRSGATEVADLLAVTKRLAEAGARTLAESLGTLPAQAAASPYTQVAGGPRVSRVL